MKIFIDFYSFTNTKIIMKRTKWSHEERILSEETKQAFKNMQELQDKMKKMFSDCNYTHFLILLCFRTLPGCKPNNKKWAN